MKITKTIPLDAGKLDYETLESLIPGETLTVHCEELRDRDNSRNTVYTLRSHRKRPDGYTYAVQTSSVRRTVTVTLVPDIDSVEP